MRTHSEQSASTLNPVGTSTNTIMDNGGDVHIAAGQLPSTAVALLTCPNEVSDVRRQIARM